MNALDWVEKRLDRGWFSRLAFVSICVFAWSQVMWAQSYAGTVLAMEGGVKELLGCAGVITAVAGVPVFLMTWGT